MTTSQRIYSATSQIIMFIVSLCLGGIGIFILTSTLTVEDIGVWIGPVLILAGVMVLSSSTQSKPDGYTPGPAQKKPHMITSNATMIIALILLFVGLFLILRRAGVINTPWLQYIIGSGLTLFGLWSSLAAGYRLFSRKTL